jgi:surfeit locus 1 family protein
MTEAPQRPGFRFPVGLTVTVAICFAILVGLGVWQLQRLKWKEAILAHVAALQTAAPVPIGPVLDRAARGADIDFTRVSLVCPGLAEARFVQFYAIHEGGQAGWRLISACPVQSAAYRTIVVDRGFIPDTISARPPVDPAATAPVEVTGILRKPDRPSFVAPRNRPPHWFVRDVAAMARALGAPAPAPVFLFAETSSNPRFAALQPAPLPTNIPNRHFEYALTWFGLAAALLGVYVAALFGRARR